MARVPRHPDEVWIEARDLRSTSGGESTVPELGLLLIEYDERVPYWENEALWNSVGQLPESDRDAEYLVATQIDGGWTFLDKVPEGSSSTLHLIGRVN